MVKEIVKDPLFLGQLSEAATREDEETARDLLDTLEAHKEECVGLAANMIGVLKRIIVVDGGNGPLLMYNPVIIKQTGAYDTQEGCLSLTGARACCRYKNIIVRYVDKNFKGQVKQFTGWTAEIIQHEVDHCNGIVI